MTGNHIPDGKQRCSWPGCEDTALGDTGWCAWHFHLGKMSEEKAVDPKAAIRAAERYLHVRD